jgi:hypothetical protein
MSGRSQPGLRPYADNDGGDVGGLDSEIHPGLGRSGGTLESERVATGEPSDESTEMPVIDTNPFRHKGD